MYQNIFNLKLNYKSVSLLVFLVVLPNILSIFNVSTLGFKIHFFQFAIFLAALIYGPMGGLLAGTLGSLYSATLMHNPYIIGGNALLGLYFGILLKYKVNVVIAVLIAFLIQLPYLIITDYYLMHLPIKFIFNLVIALVISNIIWAIAAKYVSKPIKNLL